jgi:hypothetical protein
VPPNSCSEACDDAAITFIAPAFTYNGLPYDRVTMATNGYLVAGSDAPIRILNQRFPDEDPPNNMIAPYWTDLDLDGSGAADDGAGTWYAAYITTGPDSPTWFVAEWTDAARYAADPASSHHTFQVWIEGGSDRIHMVYGPNSPIENRVTVGAENADGTAGSNYYVNTTPAIPGDEEGTPPVEGDVLGVFSTAEERSAHTITFQLRGARVGHYVNVAEMTANTFTGTNIAVAPVEVVQP